MVRTFVAIDLPEDMRDDMNKVRTILAEAKGRLTIVNPANLHITLKFLGEVDPGKIPAIIEALRATDIDPFEVTVEKATLNNPRSPRIVWCDVTDSGEIALLARQVEDLLVPLGFPRENRPFRPHVTLARVRKPHQSLIHQMHLMPSEPFGTFPVESIKLKKSTLTPHGSIYEDLVEVSL